MLVQFKRHGERRGRWAGGVALTAVRIQHPKECRVGPDRVYHEGQIGKWWATFSAVGTPTSAFERLAFLRNDHPYTFRPDGGGAEARAIVVKVVRKRLVGVDVARVTVFGAGVPPEWVRQYEGIMDDVET